MVKITDLFDLEQNIAAPYLRQFTYPWEVLEEIKGIILHIGSQLGEDYTEIKRGVWVHETATVYSSAYLEAPCIIGPNSEVRHCAFIRGNALVGENCVVGNSTELKNVILFNNVQVPHYNYVGDSILGYKSHMGAGSITSNIKSDQTLITIRNGGEAIPTGQLKIGAMLGDRVEVGCNSVLNPGTIVGRNSNIYPLSCVRGVVPEKHIWKTGGIIVKKENSNG